MKKIHIAVLAIVMLLMVSLVFAQQGQETFVSGDVSATNTPSGVVVQGEQVAVTVPIQSPGQTAHRTAAHRAAKAHQRALGAKATQADNAASLKKGEPKLKVNTTTTETDVYDVRTKNKKGVTDYGVVEKTVTNPQGKQTTEGVVYSSYAPSKAALTNAKEMEVSLAGGMTVFLNKDDRDSRYASTGFASSVTALKNVNDYLALGLDYMMLHPHGKTHGSGTTERHYHGIYAHDISLAGKLTINPWDNFRIYSPMGVGMMNARLKTETGELTTRDDKWGAAFYIGAGMQYDITCWMFAGLEYRYTYGFISDKDLTPLHKDDNLQFHTFMLRVGMRF